MGQMVVRVVPSDKPDIHSLRLQSLHSNLATKYIILCGNFIRELPGCPTCSSVNTVFLGFGGIMTCAPQRRQPWCIANLCFFWKYGFSSLLRASVFPCFSVVGVLNLMVYSHMWKETMPISWSCSDVDLCWFRSVSSGWLARNDVRVTYPLRSARDHGDS